MLLRRGVQYIGQFQKFGVHRTGFFRAGQQFLELGPGGCVEFIIDTCIDQVDFMFA